MKARTTISIDSKLFSLMEEQAEKAGLNISQYVERALEEKIGKELLQEKLAQKTEKR